VNEKAIKSSIYGLKVHLDKFGEMEKLYPLSNGYLAKWLTDNMY